MPAHIIIPPAATALTSIANVRSDMGITAERMSDADLQRKIDVASSKAATFCNRVFGVATYQETFRSSRLMTELVLDAGPVIEIKAVSMSGVPVLLDMYELEGQCLHAVSGSGNRRPWYSGQITIEYTAGWVLPGQDKTGLPVLAQNLPADIESAVQKLMSAAISEGGRDPMIKVTETEGVGRREYYVQGSRAQLAHPEAESLLDHYRRVVLA